MSSLNVVGAFIIAIWIFLIAAMVLAFVVSYGVSTSTVIYYLLRRKVDATDLDDVYVEEEEEELTPTPAPAEGEAPAEGAQAEPEKPAEEKPAGEGEAEGGEEGEQEGGSDETK
jgi:ribosomal protein L12E/L44/L45/RPP1/RPP2